MNPVQQLRMVAGARSPGRPAPGPRRRRTRSPPGPPSRKRAAPASVTGPGPRPCRAARAGLRRVCRLHRPRQLRHQLLCGGPVRVRAGLGDRAGQPDGHAGPVPVGQDRRRHRAGPARAVPRAPAAPGVGRPVAAGGVRRHGHRRGRVRRGRAGAEPDLPRAAAAGRPDHGGGGVRRPGPRAARVPALRARDQRPAGHRAARLRLRPGGGGGGPAQHRGRPRPAPGRAGQPAAGGRDHRRDGDAARGLPAFGADQVPGALPQ